MHEPDDGPRDVPTGLPSDENETPPLGPEHAEPDEQAPDDDELPGIPEPGVEPDTGG